jgi:hypothetical protein
MGSLTIIAQIGGQGERGLFSTGYVLSNFSMLPGVGRIFPFFGMRVRNGGSGERILECGKLWEHLRDSIVVEPEYKTIKYEIQFIREHGALCF